MTPHSALKVKAISHERGGGCHAAAPLSGASCRMFPPSWDPTHAAKKRKRTFLEDTDAKAAQNPSPPTVPFQSDLHNTILRRLNAATPGEAQHKEGGSAEPGKGLCLSLDHILSRVPYKTMLENMFSNMDSAVPDVPVLTKAYEETYMRQAMPGERSCAMGDQCECMQIDPTAPFVGVELRLPNDPDQEQMCALCSRATTQKCFYDMCYLSRPIKGVIQRYGGIFGQPGEYAFECMLVCPRALGMANMPVPSVSHQRNRYSVFCLGGIKHLKQHRVGFEDFQLPSRAEPV